MGGFQVYPRRLAQWAAVARTVTGHKCQPGTKCVHIDLHYPPQANVLVGEEAEVHYFRSAKLEDRFYFQQNLPVPTCSLS